MTAGEPSPQLYVVVQAPAGPALLAALDGLAVAAVLIAAPPGLVLAADDAAPLVARFQRLGAAALIEDDAALAMTLGADGAHLSPRAGSLETYADARAVLGPSRIVGADAGFSRDRAMSLAEAGADYVSFGLPPDAGGADEARERRRGLVAWWAEVFEVPCVAFGVESADEAADLAEAGADFIGARLPSGGSPEDAAKWLRAISDGIRRPMTAASRWVSQEGSTQPTKDRPR